MYTRLSVNYNHVWCLNMLDFNLIWLSRSGAIAPMVRNMEYNNLGYYDQIVLLRESVCNKLGKKLHLKCLGANCSDFADGEMAANCKASAVGVLCKTAV